MDRRPDPEWVQFTQELRRSSAASPVPSGKRYKRKLKHPKSDQDKA